VTSDEWRFSTLNFELNEERMAQFRVGIIGCGRPWRSEGASGFGMGHAHAHGYAASPDAKIVVRPINGVRTKG